jgi:heat-inducible transcriptional repressor
MEPAGVETRDRQLIESGLSDTGSFRDCLPQGSRLAAFFSNYAGVVLAPAPAAERLSRFEFLRIKRNEIVAILVTESGDVRHRHVISSEDHEAPEIERYNNFLNSILQGLTLPELRDRVGIELKKARDDYDRLRTGALTLAGQTLPDLDTAGAAGRLIIEGIAGLLGTPELSSDEKRLRSALDLLEERERLAKLLDRVMRNTDGRPAALIGSETGIESFPAALVLAAYGAEGGEPLGMIGVLGTTRLDYERIVPIVGYLASKLSRAAGVAGLA